MVDLARLLILHVLLSSHRLWPLPGDSPLLFLVPTAEALLLAAVFRLTESWSRTASAAAVSVPLAALLVFNVGEIFYRQFYLQHFNAFTDLAHVPGLARMLLPSLGVSDAVLGTASVVIAVLFVGGLSFALAWGLGRLRSRRALLRPGVLGLAELALGLALAFVLPALSPLRQMATDARQLFFPAKADSDASGSVPAAPVSAVQDADVHVLVVESYGATLLEQPETMVPMRSLYTELAQSLAGAGYVVRSGTVQSPAFGGRSWLADGTLLTGERLADQLAYDRYTEAGRPARLLSWTGQAGYRRIYAAPGTREAPPGWRLAYPFDEYLLRYDFGYEGPFVSFGAMPDQYLLNRVAEAALQPGAKDFVLYLLVSSHAPFEVIPEYRDSWSFPLKGKEFESGSLRRFDNSWVGGSELAEGYLAGIEYSLRSAVGLFTRKLSGTNVGLIVGDHQPRKPVSHATADYQVPFHLVLPVGPLSEAFDRRFPSWNLQPTFEPRLDPKAPGMESLAQLLTDVMSTEPSAGPPTRETPKP